ncbi:MAG: transcriptional regulator [Betaproteobacteria bacterium RIFCSPLOWO2_02_FULL_66_14]|nr:MAG: transcriptional regulator [Betaproteobacteria bacterium RIFCSPLOWO2_02_FULL_66_14]
MALRHTSLRRLRAFEAVARLGSFSRAAAELHLTQPAVSMQLRQLEQEIGLPLVEQMGRRLDVTPAGREIVDCARAVAARLREAEEAIAELQGRGGGELAISTVSTAKYHVPMLLAEFRRRHPNVQVRLSVSNREAVVRDLAENTIDLAIMGTPPRRLDTTAVAFAKHPIAIIAAPGHPLARRKRVALARLGGETFLIRERGSGTRSAMERFFSARRFRPRETIEMSSNETIKQAVMAGMGVRFLSLHTVALELQAKRLFVLHVDGTPVMRAWHVIHRERKRLSPVAQAFKAFLIERGAKAIAQALE